MSVLQGPEPRVDSGCVETRPLPLTQAAPTAGQFTWRGALRKAAEGCRSPKAFFFIQQPFKRKPAGEGQGAGG